LISALSLCGVLLLTAVVAAEEAVLVYAPMSVADANAKTMASLVDRLAADDDLRQAVEEVWRLDESQASIDERFDAVMQTFYLADASVRELVETCLKQPVWLLPSSFPALEQTDRDPFYGNNVLFFFARYLAVGGAYEQALSWFEQIDPHELVDPAAYLFYRAVCQHGLLLKDEGLKSISQLLEQTEDVPARYRSLASLMRADLELVEEKSLAEVARQMKDVRRRLSLGHGGPRVQEVEQKIIATLDELIEKMESQQGGSSSSASGQGSPRGNPSGSPMQDSQIGGGTGPGEVDPKDLGEGSDWGRLPAKEATEARNLINRQFPQHYRQAVEEYLRKLAERTAPSR
jgi:hypothetical protein